MDRNWSLTLLGFLVIWIPLGVGGLLVVDNAMSHPGEMKDFMSVVRGDTSFLTSLVPVGNGEFLALRVGS